MAILYSLAPGVLLGSAHTARTGPVRDKKRGPASALGPSRDASGGNGRREPDAAAAPIGMWERCRYSLRIEPARPLAVPSSQDALQKAQTARWLPRPARKTIVGPWVRAQPVVLVPRQAIPAPHFTV